MFSFKTIFRLSKFFPRNCSKQCEKVRKLHTSPSVVEFQRSRVKILPALNDNYMYLIIDNKTNQAAAVDPVDPDVILNAVEEEGVDLATILTTHHHWDHAGGNKELVRRSRTIVDVIGGDSRICGLTNQISDGTVLHIGDLKIKCCYTPCHTTGHFCYYVTTDGRDPVLFSGDTLFVGGCGKFFEGTAEQMYANLHESLGSLPLETKVFCGHEYTLKNLKFAQKIEDDNYELKHRVAWAFERRGSLQPTVPSTIGDEHLTNPFMRVHRKSMLETLNCKDPITAMQILRKLKDDFKD